MSDTEAETPVVQQEQVRCRGGGQMERHSVRAGLGRETGLQVHEADGHQRSRYMSP